MTRKRANTAKEAWAQNLRLTQSGLNLSKLISSPSGMKSFFLDIQEHFSNAKFTHVGVAWDAPPHFLTLAGALAMHCECGITILRTGNEMNYSDAIHTDSRILMFVPLVENAQDMLNQFHSATQMLPTSNTIVGFAAVCGKEEIEYDDLSVPWYCGWTPRGAKMEVSASTTVRQLEKYGLRHCTTSYEGNRMGEDRSEYWILDEMALYSVYDGHGGDIAVDFIHSNMGKLIQRKLQLTTPSKRKFESNGPNNIEDTLRNCFLECDQLLKDKLTAYGPTVKASRGYCNTGSCAVTALFHGNKLYVANVGDCQGVMGYEAARTPMHGQNYELAAKVLTTLHDCNNPMEVKQVIERSKDRNAIRMTQDDQLTMTEFGTKRVAGSLMVTRALGDWYLKEEEFSTMPYKAKVPYITAEPDIAVHELSKSDRFLILASDGLWEVVSPHLAVQVVSNYLSTAQHASDNPIPSASAALVHLALEEAARREGLAMHEILALTKGPARRSIHDDITCTVIFLEHPSD